MTKMGRRPSKNAIRETEQKIRENACYAMERLVKHLRGQYKMTDDQIRIAMYTVDQAIGKAKVRQETSIHAPEIVAILEELRGHVICPHCGKRFKDGQVAFGLPEGIPKTLYPKAGIGEAADADSFEKIGYKGSYTQSLEAEKRPVSPSDRRHSLTRWAEGAEELGQRLLKGDLDPTKARDAGG